MGEDLRPSTSKKHIIIAAVIVVIAIVILAAIMPSLEAGSTDRKEWGQVTQSLKIGGAVRANVTVLGSSPGTDLIISSFGKRALTVEAAADPLGINSYTDIVCLDCTSLTPQSIDEFATTIKEIVRNGTPLIVINGTVETMNTLLDENTSRVLAVSTDSAPIVVRAIKHDPFGGLSGCLDLGGRPGNVTDLALALSMAYSWASDRLGSVNASATTGDDVGYEMFTYAYHSGDCFEPYGRFTISNTFVRPSVAASSDGREAWLLHYRMESDPGYGAYSNDYRTGSMSIAFNCDGGGSVVRYSPGTIYDAESVDVHLTPFNDDRYTRWNYGIRDVTVINHSNMGEELFQLDHEVSHGAYASMAPYVIEPGVEVLVDADGGLSYHESYGLTMQRPSLFMWDQTSISIEVVGLLS